MHGEWEFVYGALLTPENFDISASLMQVPASWAQYGYALYGCATYRLTILTDESEALTLYIPEISSAYKLWVNGKPARSCGTVSAEPTRGRPLFENALVPAYAEEGRVELVMQISNYHYIMGGIGDTMLLGETVDIYAWYIRTRVFSCFALGAILMAAFYHLTLYLHRRRETAYLIFSSLCFLCFVRFLLETNGLNEYFQWIPMNVIGIRLYLIVAYLHSAAIVLFSLYVFNRGILTRYRYPLAGVYGVLLLVNLFVPMNNQNVFLLVMAATGIPLYIFALVVVARSPLLKESAETRLYLVALILYLIVGSTAKAFFDNVLFMTGLLTNIFMVMSQSMVLSRRYTDAFRMVEETNANLEGLVAERTARLTATNNAMKELVTNISHDLKTPLSVLSLNLETLSEQAATRNDAEYQRHVRVAYQKNMDLQRLIKNLFEVSRIETNRNLYAMEWISLLGLLVRAQEKYDLYLEDNELQLEISVKDDVNIMTDSQRIWTVFDNIIYNAVRFTPCGGIITIDARHDEAVAVVTISDTGCGIDAEHLPHIFERFYKVSSARGTRDGDSGLGLYIVRCVMESCGGRVDIKSKVGQGTSLILTFPAQAI